MAKLTLISTETGLAIIATARTTASASIPISGSTTTSQLADPSPSFLRIASAHRRPAASASQGFPLSPPRPYPIDKCPYTSPSGGEVLGLIRRGDSGNFVGADGSADLRHVRCLLAVHPRAAIIAELHYYVSQARAERASPSQHCLFKLTAYVAGQSRAQ